MRKPKLPRLMMFEGKGDIVGREWSYRLGEFRCPRKGEFYASGAIPQGWRAPNDLTTPYWIVEPLTEFRRLTVMYPV